MAKSPLEKQRLPFCFHCKAASLFLTHKALSGSTKSFTIWDLRIETNFQLKIINNNIFLKRIREEHIPGERAENQEENQEEKNKWEEDHRCDYPQYYALGFQVLPFSASPFPLPVFFFLLCCLSRREIPPTHFFFLGTSFLFFAPLHCIYFPLLWVDEFSIRLQKY